MVHVVLFLCQLKLFLWQKWAVKTECDVHTAVFKMDIKCAINSTENSAQCYLAAWMGGKLGEWIHVYVWLSHSSAHLKLSKRCQSAVLQYKIKRFLKKE